MSVRHLFHCQMFVNVHLSVLSVLLCAVVYVTEGEMDKVYSLRDRGHMLLCGKCPLSFNKT